MNMSLDIQGEVDTESNNSTNITFHLYEVPLLQKVFFNIFFIISLVLAAGNCFVFWIVRVSRHKTIATNSYIANIAVSAIIIQLPEIYNFLDVIYQIRFQPTFTCALCTFVHVTSTSVSVFNLVAIEINHYRVGMKNITALRAKQISKWIIYFLWISGALIAVPYIYSSVPNGNQLDSDTEEYFKILCKPIGISNDGWKAYIYILIFIQYIAPLLVIFLIYFKIYLTFKAALVLECYENTRRNELLKTREKAINVMITVLLLFAICWFPIQMISFIDEIFSDTKWWKYIDVARVVSQWLASSSSCCYAFLYIVWNKELRREISEKFNFVKKFSPCLFEEESEESIPMAMRR